MAFFSEIFFSKLLGKPVYTVDEKYYGEFRDFVVKPTEGRFQITKIRIRPAFGKRIILPWNIVQSIATEPVSFKLKLKAHELQPIEYDDDEFRLKRDFLDQQIIDTNKHRVVRVNDLKIVSIKDEFFVVAADIGFRGLLRRLNMENFGLTMARYLHLPFPNKLLDSVHMDPFPARLRHDIQLTVAAKEMQKMHPADLADVIEQLDSYERISMLQTLDANTMADTLAEINPKVLKTVLARWRDETLSSALKRMAPDEAADILSTLPKRRRKKLLPLLGEKQEAKMKELLKYQEDTAGALMNPEVLTFKPETTVSEAIEILRGKSDQSELVYFLYIVDEHGQLLGVVSLRDLIFVKPEIALRTVMKEKPLIYARKQESIASLIRKLDKYDLVSLPVVDKKRIVCGVITVDDVLHRIQT